MNLLTKRQRDILTLLSKREEFVTIKRIASVFFVSERTIRYDLAWIEHWLAEKNIKLIKKAGYGVKLDLAEAGSNSEHILSELNKFNQRVLSAEERRLFILLYLFAERNEITMRQIADNLGVSKNTVVSDIEVVDDLLQTAGLSLERKTHFGISLVGTERVIRGFYLRIILEGLENKYITEDDLAFIIKDISTEPIYPAIEEIESRLMVFFSDSAKKELYVALIIALYRIFIGKFIKDEEAGSNSHKISGLVRFYQEFAEINKIEIPHAEFEYIERIVMGAKTVNRRPGLVSLFTKVDAKVERICTSIINDARRYLGLDFQADLELVNGLKTHLAIAIHRLQNNLPVTNPLTEQIQFQMPFIYDMSKKIMVKHEREIGTVVPDGEIAYIAMYFGAAFERSLSNGFMPMAMVVCSSGTATSGLLITRLKIMLPEVKLVGPVPVEKIPAVLGEYEIDFIITTTPVRVEGKEVVPVNPLLGNEDLNRIKTLVFKNTSKKRVRYLSQCNISEKKGNRLLKEIAPPFTVNLNIECEDWREAIRLCSKPLLEKAYITEHYVNAMIKAVSDYGPYMVFIPEIAMAHASPEMGVKKECLSLATFKKPLYFGDKGVELVRIIVVFGALDHHLETFHDIVKIFEKDSNIRAIKNALTYEEIMNLSGS